MVLLLLACGLFGGGDDAQDTQGRPARDSSTDTVDTAAETQATGSKVRMFTTDVATSSDEIVTVRTPADATFIRMDACYDGDEIVCEMYAGQYHLYPDGRLEIEASVWDGDMVRITWIEVK